MKTNEAPNNVYLYEDYNMVLTVYYGANWHAIRFIMLLSVFPANNKRQPMGTHLQTGNNLLHTITDG